MPLENIGNTITKISFNSESVSIVLSTGKLIISADSYYSYKSFLFVGNTLSEEEINKLNKSSSIYKELKYLLSLFKVKHYSKKEIIQKLTFRKVEEDVIKYLLSWLEQYDLVNDYMLGMDLYFCYKEKNYGKRYILNKIVSRGIDPSKIKDIKFSKKNELEKAIVWLEKLEDRLNEYPINKKKRLFRNRLSRLGFDSEICNEVLKKIKDKSKSDIQEGLDKIYKRHSTKYSGLSLKNKIIKALLNKGYLYEDIEGVIDSYDY